MQFQSDILGVPVEVPEVAETTALGAAYLAGLATGYWSSRDEIDDKWRLARRYTPAWTSRAERVQAWTRRSNARRTGRARTVLKRRSTNPAGAAERHGPPSTDAQPRGDADAAATKQYRQAGQAHRSTCWSSAAASTARCRPPPCPARASKVALIDRGDFAGFTSQESSNLAWGGIKYMETFDFLLVRKLCLSRNHLIRNYPSIGRGDPLLHRRAEGLPPQPPEAVGRHLALLVLRQRLHPDAASAVAASRCAQRSRSSMSSARAGGFEYSDAYLHDNDSRFVFGFVRQAMNNGCIAANYVESLGARRDGGIWVTSARNVIDGRTFEIRSQVLVNAAGPFVDDHNALTGRRPSTTTRFSKGIHLIVDRMTPQQARADPVRQRRPAVLRHPDGGAHLHRHHRYPRRQPRTRRSPTRIAQFVLDNVNGKLRLAKPLTRGRHHRRALRRAPAGRQGDGGGERRLPAALAQARRRGRSRPPRTSASSAASSPTASTSATRSATRSGALGIDLPLPQAQMVRRAAGLGARRVRASGAADEPRRLHLAGVHRAAQPRLWRRYGAEAFALLEDIRDDPRQAEVLIKATEYIRCELEQTARRRDGRQARGLPAPPLEDRAGGPPRRDPPLARPARGLRDSVRRPGPGEHRRIFLHNRMRLGDEPIRRRRRSTKSEVCVRE